MLSKTTRIVDKFGITLFICWLAFSIAAFALFTFKRVAQFDPEGTLENISRTELVDTIFENYNVFNRENTIVNFYQTDCPCNTVSENHIRQLEQIAQQNDYKFINVEIALEQYIPSTPSIAIIGSSSTLVYFGPYGEGLGCTQTNGFATTVFENHLKGFSANLMITEAKGCYCNTRA